MSCSLSKCRHKDTQLCDSCRHNFILENHYSEYEPTCPHGYMDCICDPAYIFYHYPDWYKELHGDIKPEDASCNGCVDGDQYDDEDK